MIVNNASPTPAGTYYSLSSERRNKWWHSNPVPPNSGVGPWSGLACWGPWQRWTSSPVQLNSQRTVNQLIIIWSFNLFVDTNWSFFYTIPHIFEWLMDCLARIKAISPKVICNLFLSKGPIPGFPSKYFRFLARFCGGIQNFRKTPHCMHLLLQVSTKNEPFL